MFSHLSSKLLYELKFKRILSGVFVLAFFAVQLSFASSNAFFIEESSQEKAEYCCSIDNDDDDESQFYQYTLLSLHSYQNLTFGLYSSEYFSLSTIVTYLIRAPPLQV